jgi:hypothetical protein
MNNEQWECQGVDLAIDLTHMKVYEPHGYSWRQYLACLDYMLTAVGL